MKKLTTALHWFDFGVFIKFAGGNLVFQLVSMVSEIWVLKLVDTQYIGLWQYALLLQSYVIISRLGIINAFNRDYPYLTSLGDTEKAEKIFQTTTFHVVASMVLQGLFFLGLGIYHLFIGSDYYLTLTFFVMVIYTALEASANFEEAKLRGVLSFNPIARAKAFVSIVSILSLVLPYFYQFEGLLVRVLLIQLFLVVFFKARATIKTPPVFSRVHWLALFQDGWKFWLWSYMKSFNKSLPKLFLATFSNLTTLGLFTPINWLLLSFTLFTSSLSTYLYPTLSHRFAKGDKNLPKQSLYINLIAFAVAIPFVAVGYFSIPFLVQTFLPQYQSAILPMQITLFASLFDIITVTATIWVSMKNWAKMYLSTGLSLLFSLLSLGWLYFNQEAVLLNISVSILVSSVLSALLIVFMIFLNDNKTEKEAAILPV